MSVSDETILFNKNADEGENTQASMILQEVYAALKEAGIIQPFSLSDIWYLENRHILPAGMMQESLSQALKEMNL